MTPKPIAPYSVIVLGAGPAGLAIAYELIRRGVEPLVLEKGVTPGASFAAFPKNIFFGPWLNNLLPGSSIDWAWLLKRSTQPAYAKYLRDYAHQNRIPVKTQVQVHSVAHQGDLFRLFTSAGELRSHLLVNATGYFSRPYTPNFAGLDNTRVAHMHVSQYRDAQTVADRLSRRSGRILVVGKRLSAGETLVELHNSGFQVAVSHRGKLRFGPTSWGEALFSPIHWVAERISVALRVRKHSYPLMAGGDSRRLINGGQVATFPNILRFNSDTVVFEDGREERFDLVIFATGYRAAMGHLESLLGPQPNEPKLTNMESTQCPGLFFLGVDQQRTYRSRFLRGIVEDSRLLAELVARRAQRLPAPRREPIPGRVNAGTRQTLVN
ncbi:NAD(P)-binding domain-containing protein [bacterium]|nr:NAD(P)-binding domain-containing protein [bacterium]